MSSKWLILFIILIVGGLYFAINGTTKFQLWNRQLVDGATVHAYLGSNQYYLVVANSPASITQGLSGRNQIGADAMLFILPQPQIATFWMKGMLFDLDFVWLYQGKVVEITPKALHPQPGVTDDYLKIYSPHEVVDEVLEFPAGQAALSQIKPGDQLEIK